MSLSLYSRAAAAQTVTVTDCASATCATPSASLALFISTLVANAAPSQFDNTAVPMSSYAVLDIPSLMVLNLNSSRVTRNTFNSFRMSYEGLYTMSANYGLANSDAQVIAGASSGTVTTAAAAWTSVSTAPLILSPNTDVVFSPVLNQRLRLFGQMARFTVPPNIARLEFQPSGVASAYPETAVVLIQEDDCREITIFSLQTAQRYRFVGRTTLPVDSYALHYLAPLHPNDQEAAPGGGSIYIQVRAFDYTGAQVVANLSVDIYNVPYSNELLNALSPNKGVAGAVSWAPSSLVFPVPDTQIT